MKAFEYAAATSPESALKALAVEDAAVLAGGTDLLNRMKDYVTSPRRVVYVKDIKSLAGISGDAEGTGLTIGANTTLNALVEDETVRDYYPALWTAAASVGTPQIRNMATLAGNLLQRPRCWYYRNGHGLLGMKDGVSLVRDGDNRYHAIFMTEGNALFVAPSSMAVPLIALGARATILGPRGERTVPVEKLYVVPRTEGERELTIGQGEVLTKIHVPASPGANATYETRQLESVDWPLVLGSVNLAIENGKVVDSRVVLCGVAPIPYRAEAAEAVLRGKAVTVETATAAAEAVVAKARPLSMNAYKVDLTRTVVKRTILSAVGNRYWEV